MTGRHSSAGSCSRRLQALAKPHYQNDWVPFKRREESIVSISWVVLVTWPSKLEALAARRAAKPHCLSDRAFKRREESIVSISWVWIRSVEPPVTKTGCFLRVGSPGPCAAWSWPATSAERSPELHKSMGPARLPAGARNRVWALCAHGQGGWGKGNPDTPQTPAPSLSCLGNSRYSSSPKLKTVSKSRWRNPEGQRC